MSAWAVAHQEHRLHPFHPESQQPVTGVVFFQILDHDGKRPSRLAMVPHLRNTSCAIGEDGTGPVLRSLGGRVRALRTVKMPDPRGIYCNECSRRVE